MIGKADVRLPVRPNRLFDSDAQARLPLRGSYCMRAGQRQR